MGVKRPNADIHPSRREQVPLTKKRKVNPHPGRKLEPSNHAVRPLKNRKRDLERLLKHKDTLPADVRLNHERELQSLEYELAEAEKERRKSEMIGKYHMVRFFDRQKATRKMKQAKRKFAAYEGGDQDIKRALREEVHKTEVDVNYAQFYPLDQAYSALYPTKGKKKRKGGDESEEGSGGDADGDGQERQGDEAMWLVVEKCMELGKKKLDNLRNGKLLRDAPGQRNDDDIAAREKKADKKKSKKAAKEDKSKPKDDEAMDVDDGNDSDGGFFE